MITRLGEFLIQPIVAVVWTGIVFAMLAGKWVGDGGNFSMFAGLVGTFAICGGWIGMAFTFKRDMLMLDQVIEANHGLASALDEVMKAVENPPPLDGTAGNIEEE